VARFAARGGKLLLYHGQADREAAPAGTRDYYAAATRTLKNKDGSVRLRIVAGAGHCGDPSLDEGAILEALEDWVEPGKS
jgi:feruloyl esterase